MAAEALSSDMEKMDVQGKLGSTCDHEDPRGQYRRVRTLFSSSVSLGLILSSSYTRVFRTTSRLYFFWNRLKDVHTRPDI